MHLPPNVPKIAFVRVRTAGGPYRADDIVSVAFTTPSVGRLAAHAPSGLAHALRPGDPFVPESITVEVTLAAGAFIIGDCLTLSFVDPSMARIHPSNFRADTEALTVQPPVRGESALEPEDDLTLTVLEALDADARVNVFDSVNALLLEDTGLPVSRGAGIRVSLGWDIERAQRFVRVVDKLFTVDRLGWYRHVLAVRMLVPDEIITGDVAADRESASALHTLRSAAAQTLGRPLLGACMPNFSVTPEWLDELDGVAAARAVAALRDAILPYAVDDAVIGEGELERRRTLGIITRRELLAAPSANVEALLPIFIPCLSPLATVSQTLNDYRCALSEVFGQTAGSAEAVRLGAMSQPNHALDDRLWQLVGAIGESFGHLAVA